MMIRRTAALAALVTALFLAGCAGNGAGGPAASGPSSAGVPSAPAGAPSADVPSAPASVPPGPVDPTLLEKPPVGKPGNGTRTISGEVVAGVEANCLILRDATGDYLLIGRPSAGGPVPKVGDRVTAIGTVDTEKVTTCQQGTPFVVSEIRAG